MAEKRTKNGLPIEIHKERNYELAALEMKKKVNFSTKLSINSISCVSTRQAPKNLESPSEWTVRKEKTISIVACDVESLLTDGDAVGEQSQKLVYTCGCFALLNEARQR